MFESSKFELGAPLTGSIRHCVHTEAGSTTMRVTRAALVRIAEGDDSRSSSALAMMRMDQIDQLCRGFRHGKAPAPEDMLWVMDAADIDGIVPLAAPRFDPPRAFDAPDASEGMVDPAFQKRTLLDGQVADLKCKLPR